MKFFRTGETKPIHGALSKDFRTLAQARSEVIDGRGLGWWTDSMGFIGNSVAQSEESPEGIDYGDALQRTGFVAMGELLAPDAADSPEAWKLLSEKWRRQILKHRIGPGQYVRRPLTKYWYSRINTTTGDQLRPALISMGILGMKEELKEVGLQLIKRAGFYWNTRDTGTGRQDKPKVPGWSGPEHWNIILRGLLPESGLSKFLLLPGDVVGLLSTIFATIKLKPERADQLNRVATLVQGARYNATPVSLLSLYIFRKFRPTWRIYIDSRWNRMWRKDKNYNPGLFVLESYFWNKDIDPPIDFGPWRHICKKYFWREV
jgi:hypothetical protein